MNSAPMRARSVPGADHGSRRGRRLLLQALLPAVDRAAAKVSDSALRNGKGMRCEGRDRRAGGAGPGDAAGTAVPGAAAAPLGLPESYSLPRFISTE